MINYNQIVDTQIFNPVKAEKFGFKMNQEDCYEWETLLEGYDLILTVVIGKQQCNIRVLTLPDREPYELFEVVSSDGPFVTEIKKYWISILLDHLVDMKLVQKLIDESYGLVEK